MSVNVLDDNQSAAVTETEGYVVVIAGAGSGKTRVLASRVAYLLDRGVSPEEILCVTFTNKAADEMRSRIGTYSGRDVSGMQISTFHSLCAKILRQYGSGVGIPLDFSIYETAETHAVLNKVIREYRIRGLSSKQLQGEMDRFTASRYTLNEWHQRLKGQHDDWYADDFRRGIMMYQEAMCTENALDFSDLIQYTVKLLKMNPDILRKVSYRHVLVDEYQDSSPLEAELIQLLSLQYGNLCVVGDPRQSIYGWRGSDYRLVLNFEKTYPNAKKHILNVNYRSAKKIVEASDIIARDCTGIPYYECRPFRSDEGRVFTLESASTRDEVDRITTSVAHTIETTEISPSDIAVLCRTHSDCQSIRSALSHSKIPCTYSDVSSFYDRPEIRAALECLHAVVNSDETPLTLDVLSDIRRLYRCGVTITGLFDVISPYIIRALTLGPTAVELANNNLRALRSVTTNYSGAGINTLPVFLKSCDSRSEPVDGVSVMTVHAAKGLEFPVVYVMGMDGASMNRSRDVGEERRLFYVAMTRATDRLYLSSYTVRQMT